MKHPHVALIKYIVKDLETVSETRSIFGFQRTEAEQ